MRSLTLSVLLAAGFASLLAVDTFSITNYQLVSSQRLTITKYQVTYSASLNNTGPAINSASATATSLSPYVQVVSGADTLNFAPVPAGSQVPSSNTFSIIVDRSQPFDFSELSWTYHIAAPIANAGPNQTAKIGDTVTLDGSASTNPSGLGTLTYSWVLTHKPAGSNATLSNPNSVMPTFVVDKEGDVYIATLTVSNGRDSSMSSVTISVANTPPVANAGPNQTVQQGSTVTLDGSKSTDVNGNPLTYRFTLTSVPQGSTATLANANSVNPTFVADQAGTYMVQLIVNDGQVDSAPATVSITTLANTPPTANAGPNQMVSVGALVQLDGSHSTDPNGRPLTYMFSFNSVPAGSTATLSSTTAVNPTFTADKYGTYVVQLIVNNGISSSAASTVTISTSAMAPTANAGPDQKVAVGSVVNLSGSGTDPQNLPLTYAYTLTSKPAGSSATLANPNTQNPSFVADVPGTYVAQLIVSDGQKSSAPSTVTITTQALKPVANAGANQNVTVGSTVTLDGSGSSDPQNLPLTYAFTLTSKPAGSNATLTNANTVSPTFVADAAGVYVVQLIVNNGTAASNPATVMITAGAPSLTVVSGSGQSACSNSQFSSPLVVVLKDSNGNPVSGATVTFTLPSSGAGASFVGGQNTAITNGTGQATSPLLTANGTSGQFVISASAPNVAAPVNFNLTNGCGASTITASGGGGQSAQIGMPFATPLSVVLKDGLGNPLSGVTVTFAAPGTGASGTFTGGNTAVTDANGVANAPTFTANNTAGPYTVTATAPGISGSASFSLSNTAGGPSTITATGGNNQSAQVNTTYGNALSVTVKDAGGNPVNGALVTFAAATANNGATATFTGGVTTATTNASGVATSATLMANGIQGPFTVTAAVNGVTTPATFSLTNTAGAPGSIQVTGGDNQSATIGTAFSTPLTVTVYDSSHNPVSNATVTFAAPGSGASGTFAGGVTTVQTNNQGVAAAPVFTANNTAGAYTVSASVPGANAVNFHLTNNPGAASTIAVSAGAGQNTAVTTSFGVPLSVIVKDASGNPVPGVTVTFTAPGSGASANFAGGQNTAVTNSAGIATAVALTANSTAGSYNVMASAPGVATNATFGLTNNAGPATTITATSGTPQTAGAGLGFSAPLVATVKDANGNPVAGVVVTFTAPGNGASGTFAGGVNTATTNASGVATSAAFTANSTAGQYNVTASAPGVGTSATFALTNAAGAPGSIVATSGTPQSAAAGSAFSAPLVATVKDSNGNPVSGVTVTFTPQAAGNGASGSFAGGVNTATTNGSGVATSATFTANGTAGGYSVLASAPGVATSASFSLTNNAGPASTITATSGTPQNTAANSAFGAPLVATVKDTNGNPVAGVQVTFTLQPAGNGASATFAGGVNTATTNASGVATSAALTANGTAGSYMVAASAPGVGTASFALTNNAGTAASITATGGTPQNVQISNPFGSPLVATVKDTNGNPVAGVVVTFTAPGNGASGSFAGGVNTATTNSSGVATSATFTANGTSGSYNVTASVPGVGTSATYALTNNPGSAASVTATSGTPQNTGVFMTFGAPLVATVKDGNGNPVPGVVVTFTAPGNGASGTFAGGVNTATTNASGVATSAAFTANGTPGGYTVSASAPGVGTAAQFSLTNNQGTPATVTATGGTPQSTGAASAFSSPLVATVKDANGNPLSGIVVTFIAPSSGASGTFAGGVNTATTNSSGVATSAVFTANNSIGSYTVTGNVSGVGNPANFQLTNTQGVPSQILATGGTPQSAVVSTTFGSPLSVTVKDAGGNPLSGVTVVFTAPSNGASGTFANNNISAVTNLSGVATSAAFTANGTTGSYNVLASIPSYPSISPASFALTNTNPAPASIAATGGATQSTYINTAYPSPLTVTVLDSKNNPVAGAMVTFTAPTSGASGTFAGGSNTATVSTDSAGHASSPTFTANGGAGTFTVNATVPGVASGAGFQLTNVIPNPTAIGVSSAAVGQNLQVPITITLPQSAPTGGTIVTITSSDPNNLKVSGRANGAGLASVQVTIPAGTTTTTVYAQGIGSNATVNLTASANNFTTGTGAETVTPSGFVLSGPNGIASGFQTNTNTTTPLTLSAARLDTSGNFAEIQPLAPGVSATVLLQNSTSTVGSTTPTQQTFNPGDTSYPVTFTAKAAGNDTLTAVTPSGFSTPAGGANALNILVLQPTISIPNVSVGNNLETNANVQLQGAAPSGGLTVTVTSNDPKVLLSTDPNAAGSSQITLMVPAGLSHTADFYVQGLANSGTVTYTASAPGFGSATANVTLTPSGVIIVGPNGIPSGGTQNSFTTSSTSSGVPVTLYAGQLDSAGNFLNQQSLRGGFTLTAHLASSNTTVGTISPTTDMISGSANTATSLFQPMAVGTSNITIDVPAGFDTPQPIYRSITATVSTARLGLNDCGTLGKNLQCGASVILPQQAPSGGVQVTLTSNSPNVLLSPSNTAPGSNSIVVTIPAGQNSAPFYVQALTDTGTGTYTANASGYGSATSTITFAPSGVILYGNYNFGSNTYKTTTTSGPQPLYATIVTLDNSGNIIDSNNTLIPNQSLTVNLQSTNPGVGTYPATLTIPGSTNTATGAFQATSPGMTTISVVTPAGYTMPPAPQTMVNFNVTQ